jgi:hypothetical protein
MLYTAARKRRITAGLKYAAVLTLRPLQTYWRDTMTATARLLTSALFMFALCPSAFAQASPVPDLPKVGDPVMILAKYGKDGRERIFAGDTDGKVRQYLLVWEDGSNMPNVVTYVVSGEGHTFNATWGQGPVNPAAFNCAADKAPVFGEKSLWVATDTGSGLKFEEVEYDELKGLFKNLALARREAVREARSPRRSIMAGSMQANIMIFLKEKNRRKWAERGWLRPATDCYLIN